MKSKTSGSFQKAFKELQRDNVKITLAIVFVVVIAGVALFLGNVSFHLPLLVLATVVGGYMAMNIGANDVANAVGPLAAIVQSLREWGNPTPSTAYAPLWIMSIGGFGIALGLSLYGPKLIKTVGSEITELDKMQAFCIAMATVITVLLASKLGLPVSSTHITIGAVFGVGFLREFLQKRLFEMKQMILDAHYGENTEVIKNFLDRFERANPKQKKEMLAYLKTLQKENNTLEYAVGLSKKERKRLKKAYKSELVKRSVIKKIITAWLITVPVSALLGAGGYYLIDVFSLVERL